MRMPLTILIAAAAPPGGLEADVLVDQLATGALWAAPAALVLRAQPGRTDERLAHADLVLTAGASALTGEVSRRAAELGVPVVALGGALAGAARERYPVGIATFEPDAGSRAIDIGLVRSRLRQAAAHAVGMTFACSAAA